MADVSTSAGVRARQPYLAMQLVRGQRLDRYLEEHDLDLRQRLEIIAAVADAVHHAHLKGVVHRDLKPANILMDASRNGAARAHAPGDPRILDFGVARVTRSDLVELSARTDVGKLLGTLPYMSPEQVSGDAARVDARSDVYTIGVVGFQVLTGELPYDLEDRSLLEAARVVREDDPRRLRAVNPAIPRDVATIIATALEKSPERRYQSAAELAADVRRFLTKKSEPGRLSLLG